MSTRCFSIIPPLTRVPETVATFLIFAKNFQWWKDDEKGDGRKGGWMKEGVRRRGVYLNGGLVKFVLSFVGFVPSSYSRL